MVNKEKNMGFKIAIFDLDGTLVDSLEAISKLTNLAFEELGMEAVRKITIKDFPAFIITDDKGNDFFSNL